MKTTSITIEENSKVEFDDLKEYFLKQIGVEPTTRVLFDYIVKYAILNKENFIKSLTGLREVV